MDDIVVCTKKKENEAVGGGGSKTVVNNLYKDSIKNVNENKNNVDINNNNCNLAFKRGLKVGCINVRGIVASVNKRIELNHWIELNDLDVICIQEWYIPHGRQVVEKKENDDDNNNESDYDDHEYFNTFENEKENDQRYYL